MKLAKKIILIAVTLAAIVAVAVYWQYRQVLDYAKTPINITQEKIFTVPAGTGRVVFEGLLIEDNILEKGNEFQWLLKLRPELAQLKAGTYRLQPGMNVEQLLQLIVSGKEAQFRSVLLKVTV
ncbi:putative aminodeoxychorismate lyase [Providencia rettgeri]|nr:putative aminodeoxychorismate lyase [Providencia rettgeri]